MVIIIKIVSPAHTLQFFLRGGIIFLCYSYGRTICTRCSLIAGLLIYISKTFHSGCIERKNTITQPAELKTTLNERRYRLQNNFMVSNKRPYCTAVMPLLYCVMPLLYCSYALIVLQLCPYCTAVMLLLYCRYAIIVLPLCVLPLCYYYASPTSLQRLTTNFEL